MRSVSGSVISVQIGDVAPLGPKGVPSGFIKRPVAEPIMAGRFGFCGDMQADRRVHGGPDKAIYCYPVEHYARWRTVVPRHAAMLVPGGVGENLTTEGVDEDQVAIGDVFRIGDATVQVTQPRQPCFKLALRFNDPQMVRAMVRSGFSGWYLRVLEPGLIGARALIILVDRPNPVWSISRFNRLINDGAGTPEELAALADLPGLSHHWQTAVRASLGGNDPPIYAAVSSAEASGPLPTDDTSLRTSSIA
jgi:MOSC domain-containing protein YiiM